MIKFSDRLTNSHPINEVPPMYDITKIEAYFKRELPEQISLDEVTHIGNVRKFVDAHIAFLRGKETKPIYYPYYERLLKLAKLCTT